MSLYENFKTQAKKDFKESFHESADEWRKKLKITNDIVKSFMEEKEINEPFLLFTYDEYCKLCESTFNRVIDNKNLNIDYSIIYKSSEYQESLERNNFDLDTAFKETKEHFASVFFENVYNSIEHKIFIAAIKNRCGKKFPKGSEEYLTKLFQK